MDSLNLGWIIKVPLARGSDPYMSLFSKFTSRVVVVRSWVRFSKFHSRVVVIRTSYHIFKVYLARGSDSNMGPPTLVQLL